MMRGLAIFKSRNLKPKFRKTLIPFNVPWTLKNSEEHPSLKSLEAEFVHV